MSKISNLRRRLDFFKQELAYRADRSNPSDRVKFEIAALEWAIPILEDEAIKQLREIAEAHDERVLNQRAQTEE